jgi:cyclically-permuted mutarotase family protein
MHIKPLLKVILFLTPLFFWLMTVAQKEKGLTLNWSAVAQLPLAEGMLKQPGLAGASAGVDHHRLLVAGGSNFPDSMPWEGGKKKYYSDIYVLEKGKNNKYGWLNKKFKLPFTMAYAATVSTSNGVICIGGENENGLRDQVIDLQWEGLKNEVTIKVLPALPYPITNGAATVNGQTVYLAGGETSTGTSDGFYALDLNDIATGWKTLPALPKPVSHCVMTAITNGKNYGIYLAGGRKKNENGISDLYSSTFEFDLHKNTWEEKKSLPYSLCAGTGIACSRGSMLLFGGDRGQTFHQVETFIAAINAEMDASKKQGLILQKNKLQASHPGFSKEVLLYNAQKNKWESMGNIPFDVPVTTTAVKWDNDFILPCGEIRAGVRTPQILKANFH